MSDVNRIRSFSIAGRRGQLCDRPGFKSTNFRAVLQKRRRISKVARGTRVTLSLVMSSTLSESLRGASVWTQFFFCEQLEVPLTLMSRYVSTSLFLFFF